MASRLGKMCLPQQQNTQYRRPPKVKSSIVEIVSREHKIPEIRFEDQRLASFDGLVVFQGLFKQLAIKQKLQNCFSHLKGSSIYGHHLIALCLIVHLLLGYRKLRDMDYYRDDPMVKRLLGVTRLPDVSTVSRALGKGNPQSIQNIRQLCRNGVLERLIWARFSRLTLDFDGSVFSTQGGGREGTAVGFNRKKNGARSYYPLFCTIAQTGQVFDVYHRPGNVHDSNGAKEFVLQCVERIREALPYVTIEVRMDSAFFSDETVGLLDRMSIEFTLSVPFERFVELKGQIEQRQRWRRQDATWSYFECPWKPKKWNTRYRFLFIRQRSKEIHRKPIQLDLFIPQTYEHQYTVIVTNKKIGMRKVLRFHHWRGSQEKLFGELKSQSQMDYIAVRRLAGNQLHLMTAILAHNLTRELQMRTEPKTRGTTERRNPVRHFEELATLRHHILQRAGRFTRPKGKLTLTITDNPALPKDLLHFIDAYKEAA
jgi:hypothetical protein